MAFEPLLSLTGVQRSSLAIIEGEPGDEARTKVTTIYNYMILTYMVHTQSSYSPVPCLEGLVATSGGLLGLEDTGGGGPDLALMLLDARASGGVLYDGKL